MKRVQFLELTLYQQELLTYCDRIAKISKCLSRKVGAFVDTGNMVTQGEFNRPPHKMPSCEELGGCPENAQGQCLNCLHAEEIICLGLSRLRTHIQATMYITCPPCYRCANLMIERGIQRVICYELARDTGEGIQRLVQAGVEVILVERSIQ